MTEWYSDSGEKVTERDISMIMSGFSVFGGFEIGEDNEGQLIIYTGLYSKLPKNKYLTNRDTGDEM